MRSKVTVVESLLLLVLALVGCSSPKSGSDNELAALNAQSAELKQEIARVVEENRKNGIIITPLSQDWILREATDKLDGSKSTKLYRRAETGEVLVLACDKHGKTDVYVDTHLQLDTSDYKGKVRFKLDDRQPIEQSWYESDDDEALFAPSGLQFAEQLASRSKLLFEYRPFRASEKIAEFNLLGLREHLSTVTTTCNWKAKIVAKAKLKSELH